MGSGLQYQITAALVAYYIAFFSLIQVKYSTLNAKLQWCSGKRARLSSIAFQLGFAINALGKSRD